MGRSLVENADYTERSKDLGGKRHYERTPPLSGPHFRGRMKADCVISPGENCSSVCRLCRSLWSGGTGQAARLCCTEIRALHEKLLTGVDTPPASALLAFFWSWEPEKALAHPALAENLEEILSGANLVFRTDGGFVHEDPAVRHVWEACCHSTGDRPAGGLPDDWRERSRRDPPPLYQKCGRRPVQRRGPGIPSMPRPSVPAARSRISTPHRKICLFLLYCRLSLSNRIRRTGLRSFSLFYFSSPIRIV